MLRMMLVFVPIRGLHDSRVIRKGGYVANANNKDPGQLSNPRSLVRTFAIYLYILQYSAFGYIRTAKAQLRLRMRNLIWAFAIRMYPKAYFHMTRLKWTHKRRPPSTSDTLSHSSIEPLEIIKFEIRLSSKTIYDQTYIVSVFTLKITSVVSCKG